MGNGPFDSDFILPLNWTQGICLTGSTMATSLFPRKQPGTLPGLLLTALILSSFSSPGNFLPEKRDLSVLIVADEEFAAAADWKVRAERSLAEAAADFERLFGIVLKSGGFTDIESDDSLSSLNLLAEDLESRVMKGKHDIAVIFTRQENLDQAYYGYSLFKEAVIVIKADRDEFRMVRALKHELAHLFGAVHVDDDDSVMDLFSRGSRFDSRNARIISLNKNRSFHGASFPLPRENLDETASLAREIALSLNLLERDLSRVGERFRYQDLEDVHLLLAQIDLEQEKYEKAIAECRTALRINPDNLEGINLWGVALRRSGRIDEAIEKYLEILGRRPNHARVIYNLGVAYSKKGDLTSALDYYHKAIELKPNFVEAHSNAGDVYLRLGKDAEAETAFRRAIEVGPHFALAYANLGEVDFRRGDFGAALAEAEKALSIDPGLAEAFNLLGKVHRKTGDLERAKNEFSRAISLNPKYERAYHNLGNCHLDEGRAAEAEKKFLKAIELNPAFAEAWAGLGDCRLFASHPEEAAEHFHAALERGLDTPAVHLNLSTAYLQLKEFAKAMEEARRVLDLDPASSSAHNNLGIVYTNKGMIREALAEFEQSLRLDPQNKNALANLGSLYLGQGKFDLALDLCLKASAVDPANAILHNNLAVIYFEKGEYAKSWEHVHKAEELGLKPHPNFLRELSRKSGK